VATERKTARAKNGALVAEQNTIGKAEVVLTKIVNL